MTEPRTVQVFTKDINDKDGVTRNLAPQVVRIEEAVKSNPKGAGVASSSPVTNEPAETAIPDLQDQLDFETQSPEAEPWRPQNPSAPMSDESQNDPSSSPSPAPSPLTFPPSQPSRPVPPPVVSPTVVEPAGE